MALDKVAIGLRIRKIREEIYHENRSDFSYRCSITESHLGQIERGEIMISLNALDKIVVSTGTDTDYLLYGKNYVDENKMKKIISNFLNRANKDELKVLFKCFSSIKEYIDIKDKDRM